jgi:hypothetical protein
MKISSPDFEADWKPRCRPMWWHVLRVVWRALKGLPLQDFLNGRRRRLQQKALIRHGHNALSSVVDALREAEVEAFLTSGTLVGCLRDGAFPRGDYDIDFGLLPEQAGCADALTAGLKKRGFVLIAELFLRGPLAGFGNRSTLRYGMPATHLYVDFKFYHAVPGGFVFLVGRELDYYYEGAQYDYAKDLGPEIAGFALLHPADDVAPLRRMTFMGLEVLIPRNADDFLTDTYGDWRRPLPRRHVVLRNFKGVRFAPSSGHAEFVPVR